MSNKPNISTGHSFYCQFCNQWNEEQECCLDKEWMQGLIAKRISEEQRRCIAIFEEILACDHDRSRCTIACINKYYFLIKARERILQNNNLAKDKKLQKILCQINAQFAE